MLLFPARFGVTIVADRGEFGRHELFQQAHSLIVTLPMLSPLRRTIEDRVTLEVRDCAFVVVFALLGGEGAVLDDEGALLALADLPAEILVG